MLLKLFLAFALIPIAEIYVIIKIGGLVGALNTVLVILFTAMAGAYLARLQGMQTMLRVRTALEQGMMPTEELVDALLIFLAGIVLLTPGFITDLAGLFILLPATRHPIRRYVKRKFTEWLKNQDVHMTRLR